LEYAIALLLLAVLVALVVAGPLRRPGAVEERDAAALAELEARKEAKYREIRDAELDHGMGKLSDPDWREIDRELRGEAMEILRAIDKLDGERPLP
jgi:hypothetical protein